MLTLVDHPILKRDIAILRDKDTPHGLFRVTLADA
ncbi:MAG: uracil phosphoribosyltransferase, partial [Bacteroidota bacterium]